MLLKCKEDYVADKYAVPFSHAPAFKDAGIFQFVLSSCECERNDELPLDRSAVAYFQGTLMRETSKFQAG